MSMNWLIFKSLLNYLLTLCTAWSLNFLLIELNSVLDCEFDLNLARNECSIRVTDKFYYLDQALQLIQSFIQFYTTEGLSMMTILTTDQFSVHLSKQSAW